MKIFLISLLMLSSVTTFAADLRDSGYCLGRGQDAINSQKELLRDLSTRGEIDSQLKTFFETSLRQLQENHDFLCKGKALPKGSQLSAREKQLQLIKEGVESNQMSEELAEFFLQNLK